MRCITIVCETDIPCVFHHKVLTVFIMVFHLGVSTVLLIVSNAVFVSIYIGVTKHTPLQF